MKPLDRRKILAAAARVVAAFDCELLEAIVTDAHRVKIVVDRDDGPLDTNLLVSLIKTMHQELTDAKVDPGQLDIEFDTPGERRLLVTARHFERFAGQSVRVTLAKPDENGAATKTYELLGADDDAPRVRGKDGDLTLPRHTWKNIRLLPEPAKRRPESKSKLKKKAKREAKETMDDKDDKES